MILPVLVTVGAVGVLGVGAWYLKEWAYDGKPPPIPPRPNGDPAPEPGPTPGPRPDGGGKQGDKCGRTGERYDAGRWSSPVAVAAGLLSLGYGVSPALTTSDDKKAIRRFQKDASAG